jgi:hypothetical protein
MLLVEAHAQRLLAAVRSGSNPGLAAEPEQPRVRDEYAIAAIQVDWS